MFYLAIAAVLAAAAASASAAPGTSPSPAAVASPAAAAQVGPLREIVYKTAQTDSGSGGMADYGGTYTGSGSAWELGTLTIDVMQVLSGNTLAVRVTEAWNSNGGRPFTLNGYVAPDGTLSLVSGTYSAVMETILPYVSSGFIGAHDMSVGTSWNLTADAEKVHFDHRYAVTKINGTDVTITIDGKMTGFGMSMYPTTEHDTVVYRPSRLVAISGDFATRSRSSNGTEDATISHSLHFERISDTRDP